MSIRDDKWIKDYIEGMESLGIEFTEMEKKHMIAKGINEMIDSFGGENDGGDIDKS